jgi:transposase-like protein
VALPRRSLEGDGFEPSVPLQIRCRFQDGRPVSHDGLTVSRPGTRSSNPVPSSEESVSAIAGLLDRSTQELRRAWRQLHRTGPPLGLSRDLLIRALAYQLQERAHGASAALRRRLQSLATASAKGALAVDTGIVPKAGTTLVRQWRGHTHTVLVHNDGFEHEASATGR